MKFLRVSNKCMESDTHSTDMFKFKNTFNLVGKYLEGVTQFLGLAAVHLENLSL